MDTIRICVPGLPPAGYSGNVNLHKIARRQVRDDYIALVIKAIEEEFGGTVPRFEPCRSCLLTVTFRMDRKRRDWDNLVARLKPGLDALVKTHLMTDDSTDIIKRFDLRTEYSKMPETVYELERLR